MWEEGSSDADGTNIDLGALGGLAFGGGDTDTGVHSSMLGTWVGGTATKGRLHLHQETAAARRCAPPLRQKSSQRFNSVLAWGCAIAAIGAFVMLLVNLNQMGFLLGANHFRRVPSGVSRLFDITWKEAGSFTLGSWFALLLARHIAHTRLSEEDTFNSAMQQWVNTYYCERDGWIGIP